LGQAIAADEAIRSTTERAVRCAASRFGVALGVGLPFTLSLPLKDRNRLAAAAAARRMNATALAVTGLSLVVRDHLFNAVIDDTPSPEGEPAKPNGATKQPKRPKRSHCL